MDQTGINKLQGAAKLKKIAEVAKNCRCENDKTTNCIPNPEYDLKNIKDSYKVKYYISKKNKDSPNIKEISDIEKILNGITDEDAALLGFAHGAHPRDMILKSFAVIPPVARPFTVRDGQKKEDHLTTAYDEIINDNFTDQSICTTQLDVTSSTTLTNVVGMVTDTLQPGTYSFRIVVPTVCTANNGSKFALKWGTASMITSQEYEARAFTASAVAVTRGTTATDATLLCDNASAVVIFVEITGVCVVAIAGTLQFQASEHTSHADTFSVFKNAFMEFSPVSATNPLSTAMGL
jgi:hypothetical protein